MTTPNDKTTPARRNDKARYANLLKRTASLCKRGQYDDAIAVLNNAIAMSPREPKCRRLLSDVYRAQNRMGLAIDALVAATEVAPYDTGLQEHLLRVLLEMQRYDQAIAVSRRLLELSPTSLFARDILGIAYLQQGKLDNALHVAEELIRLDPTDSTHHFKKAVLLQQKGEIADAMCAFTRTLEMDPEGEMADDARDAIAALDSYQLRQVLTLVVGDTVFRAKLTLDAEAALIERGFRLSSTGVATLKQLNLEDLPQDGTSRYYH